MEAQPVVETISNDEPLNKSIPQPVVTSEPVVENVVSTVEQNVVVENNTTNEVPVEIVPSVEPIKDETVKPVTVNETIAENVVPNVEQNVVSENNNNEIQVGKPIEVAPVVESQPVVETIKEETVKPVTVNEQVAENVVSTVEQNVQQSVNNNM